MANPTRRIYVTDAEAQALERVVAAAKWNGVGGQARVTCIPDGPDLVAVERLLTKLDQAGSAQPNRI